MAYAELEPFGEERADLRSGIIASVLANVNRDAKKHPKPFTPQDFMPVFERPDPMSTSDQIAMIEMLNAAFGGVDLRGRKRRG